MFDIACDNRLCGWMHNWEYLFMKSKGDTTQKTSKIVQQDKRLHNSSLDTTLTEKIDDLKDKLIDILDDYFPKGKCKERGQAIVFLALALIEIKKWHNSEVRKARTQVLEQLPITGIIGMNGRRTDCVLASEVYDAININEVINQLKENK